MGDQRCCNVSCAGPAPVLLLSLSCIGKKRSGADTCESEIKLVMMILLCLLFCIYECYDCYAVVVPVPVLMDCSVVHTVPLTVPISNIINNDDVVLFVVLYLL